MTALEKAEKLLGACSFRWTNTPNQFFINDIASALLEAKREGMEEAAKIAEKEPSRTSDLPYDLGLWIARQIRQAAAQLEKK